MIIDLRYHIASLVAVFLALGLGILLGGIFLKSDILVSRQKELTDRLEVQIEQLRQKNETVENELSLLKLNYKAQGDFEKQVLPLLVKGRLQGYQLAIVETNNYSFSNNIIEAIQLSGAEVSSVTTLIGDLNEPANKELLKGQKGWESVNENQLAAHLAGNIVQGLLGAGNSGQINSLVEVRLIKISGEYGKPLNGVIIAGGSQEHEINKNSSVDLPMIDLLLARQIPVYGVEETTTSYSYMKEYQKKRISTVDNIDTVPGQAALVMAIAGQAGHYGIKPTAQKLIPALSLE
ncbi:MAG: hypothetical protein XD78_1282 [Desulfotomaculum sp. 46_296]|nr:MAG: hypothetical protein XD78_1282 [Desulfotomaculum sp. 46_296]HAU31349.1 copper transporter [Desulfotomaculum sp.]